MVVITGILIGYVLSNSHFDWLIGNMSIYQENLFSVLFFSILVHKPHFPSFVKLFSENIS